MRNKQLFVSVTLLVLIGCAKKPSGQAPTDKPTEASRIGISSGYDTYNRVLEIQVSDLASTYLVGSPIPITVQIKNLGPKQSDSEVQSVHPGAQLFPFLTVWVEQNSKLTTESINLPIENRIWIKQGETFERSVDLSNVKALSSPGQYNISIGHENYAITDIGDWTGTLRSRSQKIKIVEKE